MSGPVKYFLDTEFIDDGERIHLISIGIIDENDRTFYGEVVDREIPWHLADQWVKENVRPLLHSAPEDKYTKAELRDAILAYVFQGGFWPEFWGYYADWDWVVFLHLFGKMIDAPGGWPMFCLDIKQWAHQLDAVGLPRQLGEKHDALNDARWHKKMYEYLVEYAKK